MDDPARGAVLLDFGGTIDGDGERWSVRFHRAYRAEGGRLDFTAFEPLFKESDRRLERLAGVERLGYRATVEAQAGLLWPLLPDGSALEAARVVERFHRESLAAIQRNAVSLRELRGRWTLGVISNYTGNLGPCLAELKLADLFAVALDSAVVGIAKPDPRIFRLALERVGAAAADAWMVGDNFEADIRPAAALGWSTVWVAPGTAPTPREPGRAPTERIAALPELSRVLEAACTA